MILYLPLRTVFPAGPAEAMSKEFAPSALSVFNVKSRWYSITLRFLKYVTYTCAISLHCCRSSTPLDA